MPDTATATIGHNAPPSVAQQVQEALALEHQPLVQRRDELLQATERAPMEIANDDVAGRFGDQIKMITACIKASETARTGAKEPHLEAGRAVDGWFKKVSDPLATAKRALQARLDTYLRKKADEERRRREAEVEAARKAAAEAAATMQTGEQLDAAVAAEEAAQKVQAAAQAKPAEMARTRGDYGAVATLRTTWDFEVIDAAAVPRVYLMINEQAIRAAIRGGARSIAGINIFEKSSAVVR